MSLRLLKFDVIHPIEYLHQKKADWTDLPTLSRQEYLERLLALRSNYSDFYTHYLRQAGWEAEEFFLMDHDFMRKTARELYGRGYYPRRLSRALKNKLRPKDQAWPKEVIADYVEHYKPDVLFIRSHPLESEFWHGFRDKCLVVGRLSARLPFHWHPNHFDLLYTDQPDFQRFFALHGVPSFINKQGFDPRINAELELRPKRYELSFVGGLGTQNFLQRTEFMSAMAQAYAGFKWWGYWWPYGGDGRSLSDFPALRDSHQGITSGLEMFQTFRDSCINLNDYVDTANGVGFNQRMFEVMGSGSFLLTREAPNFSKTFPADIFITYRDREQCLDRINYFLKHDKEREEIAARARQFVEEHYNYADIAADFSADLKRLLNQESSKR